MDDARRRTERWSTALATNMPLLRRAIGVIYTNAALSLVTFVPFLSSCSSRETVRPPTESRCNVSTEERQFRWLLTPPNPTEVLFLVHGLNTCPAALDEFAGAVATGTQAVLRVNLTGHHEEDEARLFEHPDQIIESWDRDIDGARIEVGRRYPGVKTVGIGFSLGGLLLTRKATSFARLILFAPAMSLTRRAELVRLFFPFGGLELSLPSLAPKAVRSHDRTPVNAYRALFRLVAQSAPFAEPIPRILLLGSNDDELVDLRHAAATMAELGAKPTVKALDSLLVRSCPYRHLLFCRSCYTDETWDKLRALVQRFAAEPSETPPSRQPAGEFP